MTINIMYNVLLHHICQDLLYFNNISIFLFLAKIRNIMEDVKILFGKRLRELRKRNNMTQEKLAEIIGIEPRNILKIENGKSFPRISTMQKIMEIFDCKASDLFEFEHLDDISVVREKLINKINNDENFTRMVYKLIK